MPDSMILPLACRRRKHRRIAALRRLREPLLRSLSRRTNRSPEGRQEVYPFVAVHPGRFQRDPKQINRDLWSGSRVYPRRQILRPKRAIDRGERRGQTLTHYALRSGPATCLPGARRARGKVAPTRAVTRAPGGRIARIAPVIARSIGIAGITPVIARIVGIARIAPAPTSKSQANTGPKGPIAPIFARIASCVALTGDGSLSGDAIPSGVTTCVAAGVALASDGSPGGDAVTSTVPTDVAAGVALTGKGRARGDAGCALTTWRGNVNAAKPTSHSGTFASQVTASATPVAVECRGGRYAHERGDCYGGRFDHQTLSSHRTLHLIFLATTQCDHGRATGDQFGRSTTAAAILTQGRLRSRGEPSGACDLDRLTPSVRLLPSGWRPARWKRAAASGLPSLWDF
jgi:hypothetical protein